MTNWTASMALMLKYGRMRLTLDEAAGELGIAPRTLINRIYANDSPVPWTKDGKSYFFDVRDLGDYLDKQREEAQRAFNQAKAA